jgi:L-asparaginase
MPIHIFTTGGTIDKFYSTQESDLVVGTPVLDQALREANVQTPYVVEPLLRKDSLEMTSADRDLIRRKVSGASSLRIIITHGTDTMVDTAKYLDGIADKTILLTGAMQPASFKTTDAVFNVGYALAAVQLLPAGVYIAMNGSIFDPKKARKNVQKNCFEVQE